MSPPRREQHAREQHADAYAGEETANGVTIRIGRRSLDSFATWLSRWATPALLAMLVGTSGGTLVRAPGVNDLQAAVDAVQSVADEVKLLRTDVRRLSDRMDKYEDGRPAAAPKAGKVH